MKKRLLALIIAGIMLFAVGCGSADSSDSGSYEAASTSNAYYSKNAAGFEEAAEVADVADVEYEGDDVGSTDFDADSTGSESDIDLDGYDTSRKLVYTSYITLESKKFDEDVATIKELVTKNGGYFESTSVSGNKEYGNRGAGFVARIPSDKYEAFMGSVGDVGSLTYKSESVDDITSSYVDVQARLKSLNTKLERLQELESNAENVTELLEIEDRINEVQYQIESYTAQMKTFDDQVDYSTVSIDITEVATYSEVKADSAWNRFVEAFGASFVGFVETVQEIVIAIIYLLPYILIVAIVIVVIVVVRRRKKKAREAKVIQADESSKTEQMLQLVKSTRINTLIHSSLVGILKEKELEDLQFEELNN